MITTLAVPQPREWKTNAARTVALHKSGLSLALTSEKFPAIDILGIARLKDTEWAGKANIIVNQGLTILDVPHRRSKQD